MLSNYLLTLLPWRLCIIYDITYYFAILSTCLTSDEIRKPKSKKFLGNSSFIRRKASNCSSSILSSSRADHNTLYKLKSGKWCKSYSSKNHCMTIGKLYYIYYIWIILQVYYSVYIICYIVSLLLEYSNMAKWFHAKGLTINYLTRQSSSTYSFIESTMVVTERFNTAEICCAFFETSIKLILLVAKINLYSILLIL